MSSSSDPKNSQAQVLLQTLCKFILPLIQAAVGQAIDPKDIRVGVDSIEGDAFIMELEKFISGLISRSQPRNQDISIEAELRKDSKELVVETTISTPLNDEAGASSHDEGNLEHIQRNRTIIPLAYHGMSAPVSLSVSEEALENDLRDLRHHVTQKMPIRLLCFEPLNYKLKISLFERADVYNYLAHKIRACASDLFSYVMKSQKYKRPGYAILSHTWNQTPGELTYGDWKNGSIDASQPKCQKLVNFCQAAWDNHGLTFGWIDTVCINKDSSAELDESIRSMYAWYRDAEVCITYLAGSNTMQEMHDDPWFTRGWTLQELVAPGCIKFYNKDWKPLASDWLGLPLEDKNNPDIQSEIHLATTITSIELRNIQTTSISRRMQLVAKRQVTREEDIAYCLMGIFDVSISTAYGEGNDRAFFRLVEEIFRSTKDVSDIFNWAGSGSGYFSRQHITFPLPILPTTLVAPRSCVSGVLSNP